MFTENVRWMLKAPPLIPWDYKSGTSKKSPGEGCLNVQKYVRKNISKYKKVNSGPIPDKKKVDKNAIVPINVISQKWYQHNTEIV